jgi:hypothetical protein
MADIAELGLFIDSSGVIRATKELRKLHGQSEKTEKSTEKLKGSFGGLKSVVAAVASSIVVSKFIETAGAFESMSKSLETVTGSAEKATLAMAGIREFAQDTPFQVQEITQAFIKLKALGIQPTEENLRSFGNTSAAMGKSLNQMIEAVADAATGEFERLKEFGIKARSEGDNVSLTFQGVTTTIGKNSEEITGYLESIGQTQFAGAMSMQMDTINGKISNLGDSIDNLFVTFAEAGAGEGTKGALDSIIGGVDMLTAGVRELPSLFVAGIAEFDKMATEISFGARSLYEDITGLFDSDQERLLRQQALNEAKKEELQLIDEVAQSFINAEQAKQEATAEGAIATAGAESPEMAAERIMLKAEAEAEAQNEVWADELFRAQEHAEHMLDIEYDRSQRAIEIQQEEANARRAVMDGMFGNLISLMNSGSKKMFNIGKVAALANGLLNLKESVMSAYAAGSEVGGPIVGAAFAATAGLAQAANLAKIKSASFGGGGGGGATAASTTGGAPVTGSLGLEPPPQEAAPTQERRLVIEADGVSSPAMRQLLVDLQETAEDMGGITTISFA